MSGGRGDSPAALAAQTQKYYRPPALSGATLDQRDTVLMDVAVLLLFALFFTALVVTMTGRGHSGSSTRIRRNGSAPGSVGSSVGSAGAALAIYSLLVCVISASSLFRRRVRSAIDPQEG